MNLVKGTKGQVDIGTLFVIAIAIAFAAGLVGTVVTSTDSALEDHDFASFTVTDERVNWTGLPDTAIALTFGGSNSDIFGTPIIANSTGVQFVNDSGGNYTISLTTGTILINATGELYATSADNLTDIDYNYSAWDPATLTNYTSAQNIAELLPFLFIAIPVIAAVSVLL